MMRKVQSASILLLALVILLLPLTGCDDSSLTPEEKQYANTQTLPEATVTFYLIGEEKPDARLVLDEIEKRSKDALNAHLVFKWFDFQQYVEKIKGASAAGEPFDAFICGRPESYLNFDYIEMARKGELKDITDLFPKAAPDLYSRYSEEELRTMKIDGRLYIVPSLMPSAYCTNVWVNKDFINAYNIPPIRTLEDYTRFLKTIKENERAFVPGAISYVSTETFARMFGYIILDNNQHLVYRWNDPSMKVIPWEQTPEFREVALTLTDWHKNNYLRKNGDTLAQEQMASILSGDDSSTKEESISISSSDGKTLKEYEMYRYHLYPGVPIQRTSPVGNIYMNGAVAFPANAPNADRALLFLDWFQKSQENYDLLHLGIERKHYSKKDGKLEILDEGPNYKYLGWSGGSAFRNMKYMINDYNDKTDMKKDYLEFIQNETRYAPHEGFHPDYTAISDLTQTRARVFSQKINHALTQGTFDPDKLDELIEELRQSGTGRIVEEVQKQLAAWVKQNK